MSMSIEPLWELEIKNCFKSDTLISNQCWNGTSTEACNCRIQNPYFHKVKPSSISRTLPVRQSKLWNNNERRCDALHSISLNNINLNGNVDKNFSLDQYLQISVCRAPLTTTAMTSAAIAYDGWCLRLSCNILLNNWWLHLGWMPCAFRNAYVPHAFWMSLPRVNESND